MHPPRPTGDSADLFSQGDDDACGAADITVPVDALVLRDLAQELGAVGAQAGDGVVNVVDGEHDAMQAQRVGRRVLGLGPAAAGVWYLDSSALLWPPGSASLRCRSGRR
jgi:hypothetical protein